MSPKSPVGQKKRQTNQDGREKMGTNGVLWWWRSAAPGRKEVRKLEKGQAVVSETWGKSFLGWTLTRPSQLCKIWKAMVWKQGFGDNWDTNGLLGCFSGHAETRTSLLSIQVCLPAPESCFPTACLGTVGCRSKLGLLTFRLLNHPANYSQPRKNTALHVSLFR